MQLITQRNNNDCMLACIAMIANLPYDTLWTEEFVQKVVNGKGASHELTKEALAIAGFKEHTTYWCVNAWERLDHDSRRLFYGRRAILSVPSLNTEHAHHAVAWDGKLVLDPSPKQVYRWLDQLSIVTAWIFNEVSQ